MRTILMTTAALLMAACADETETAEVEVVETDQAAAAMDVDGMDHDAAMMTGEGMGMGEGRVIEVDAAANQVRIDHGPIEGIMDAMTMSFEAQRGVALGGLEPGDEVHFLLDQGRDGTYRLAAICDVAATDHEACMARMREAM